VVLYFLKKNAPPKIASIMKKDIGGIHHVWT